MSPPFRPFLARVALIAGGIVLALLTAEGLLRVIGLPPHYGVILPLGDVPVRRVDGTDLWGTHHPRADADDVERAARSSAFTIVGLGDSIMYGAGQDADETYLQQTRRRLEQRGVGSLEILNLAVPGYNTRQEAAVFSEIDDRLDPNLIIVHYWGNDARQYRVVGGYVVDYGDLSDDGHFVVRALPLPQRLSDFLLIHSRAYELLTQFVVHLKRRGIVTNWTDVSDPMTAIDERVRRGGGRLLILASPEVDGAVPRSAVDLPTLRQFAASRGIEVIDLAEWVRDRPSEEVSFDGVHFNAEGHRIIGERLADYLLAHDLKDRVGN